MSTPVKASCHCGLNSFTIPFTTDSLPVLNDLCHCSSCRHATGQLTVNYVPFPGVPLTSATSEPADLKSTLTSYTIGPIATRWFCRQCSAHILWEYTNKDAPSQWCIAVGTLERTEGIVKTGYHIWISDTLDGGIADYFTAVDGLELPRYKENLEPGDAAVLPAGWRSSADTNAKSEDYLVEDTPSQDLLPASCRCGAISFSITRPSEASAHPTSPYPDLIHPYHSTPADVIANPQDEKWWLRPAGAAKRTHYLAGHCACTTCRLTSGFELQSWAIIPKANILVPRSSSAAAASVGKPPSPNELTELQLTDDALRPAGLRQYKSSVGRNREFCGTCGATSFWWSEDRPELVDVSVALFDEKAAGGVRAERWVEWWKGRVGFEEEAVNKTLVGAFSKEFKE
ncbi:hypothetical protein DXG03_003686 [Asterophora parasitica]|uniref:CENP-V/GFA domain-containing protein n=1 Tax=Asterophora parasitica TaxID=117018 RepID=A0A9P7KDB1_9AGAR|nr:hypothetical protein DXG03_003686 [Asterophora parasitica]